MPEGVRELASSPEEIAVLFVRYRRHMKDAGIRERDDDSRYCTFFDAGLVLAKMAVRAHGWRVSGAGLNHHLLIKLAAGVLGRDSARHTSVLEHARTKRNHATYDEAGTISHTEVVELESVVKDLERLVRDWLAREHSDLLPPELPLG